MDLLKWFRREPPVRQRFIAAPPHPSLTKGQFITCPKCKKKVASWRTYASGKQECASCASLR